MANTDFEFGVNGDTITTTNSGLAVVSNTSSTMVIDTAQAFRGTRSAKITATTASTSIAILGKTGTASDTAALRAVIRGDWPTTTTIDLGSFRNSAGNAGKYQWTSTGKLQFAGITGTPVSSTATTPQTAADPNAWWTFEAFQSMPTNTVKFRAYVGNNFGSPFATYSNTAADVGTTQFTGGRIGKLASPGSWTGNIDDFDWVPGASDYLGPANANIIPVSNAGPDASVEPWSTVILDGTSSSDPDGTISTYAWTQISGTAVTLSSTSTATPSFAAPASTSDQTLVFGLTVTDNLGAVSTQDTVTVTVLRANEMAAIGGIWVPMQITAY